MQVPTRRGRARFELRQLTLVLEGREPDAKLAHFAVPAQALGLRRDRPVLRDLARLALEALEQFAEESRERLVAERGKRVRWRGALRGRKSRSWPRSIPTLRLSGKEAGAHELAPGNQAPTAADE